MAMRLTLPGVKPDKRRLPQSGLVAPTAPGGAANSLGPTFPDNREWMLPPTMQSPQQAPYVTTIPRVSAQQPVSTGLDPAIVARAANKAGISDATLNKLATMIPALLDALSTANAPRDLVRDASGKITGSVVRQLGMTGQTSG